MNREELKKQIVINFENDEITEKERLMNVMQCIDAHIEQLSIPRISNCAISMEEILNEAQRRQAKHSVQYADYSLDTWTVANDLLEHRKNALLADGSVRKVRIEYEM